MKQTAFRPGDRVVLPPYGLGIVSGTCQHTRSGEGCWYYQVDFPESGHLALVPTHSPDQAGLRPALRQRELRALRQALERGQLELARQCSSRQRQVNEVLRLGQLTQLALLIAELYRWQRQRPLPDLDRQALRQAIRLLQQEVSGLEDSQALAIRDFLLRATASLNE